MSGNRHFSTALPAPAAPSSTPTAGTTRDVIQQPADWRNVPFLLTDTAGMFGQSEDPLQKQVLEHGWRALEHAVVVRVCRRRPRGAGARRSRDRGGDPREGQTGHRRHQQGRRQTREGRRARLLRARVRAGHGDFGGARPGHRRSARRSDRAAAGEQIRRAEGRRARAANCDRGPPECGEVVARQSHPARRAHARQRSRRHDTRLRRHQVPLASAPVPHRRHRRHSQTRPRGALGSGRVGQRAAGQTCDCRCRSHRAGDRRDARARPIRTAPSRAKPSARGAA